MNFPLDRDTATADLLGDIFPATLRQRAIPADVPTAGLWDLSDADLCALVGALSRCLIERGELMEQVTSEGRTVAARRMVALAVLNKKIQITLSEAVPG